MLLQEFFGYYRQQTALFKPSKHESMSMSSFHPISIQGFSYCCCLVVSEAEYTPQSCSSDSPARGQIGLATTQVVQIARAARIAYIYTAGLILSSKRRAQLAGTRRHRSSWNSANIPRAASRKVQALKLARAAAVTLWRAAKAAGAGAGASAGASADGGRFKIVPVAAIGTISSN